MSDPVPTTTSVRGADEGSAADELPVTVAIMNYNGMRVLPICMAAVLSLTPAPSEILIVDDGSTDGSAEWVERRHQPVRIVRMERNTGLLNHLRNAALESASHDRVMIVDNDVLVAPDCLGALMSGMDELPQAGCCIARTILTTDHSVALQGGQKLHFVGATPTTHRDVPLADLSRDPALTIGQKGAMLIDRQKARAVGGFNEAFVMGWGDDGEFHMRMTLAGHHSYHIPGAVMYHGEASHPGRFYGTIANRWRFLLECYQLRTLVVLTPALLAYELSLFAFMTSKGMLRAYLKAVGGTIGDFASVLRDRRRTQRLRTLSDRALVRLGVITGGSVHVARNQVDSRVLRTGMRFLNGFLALYWTLFQGLI